MVRGHGNLQGLDLWPGLVDKRLGRNTGGNVLRKYGKSAVIAAAAVAVGTVGFAGTALAGGEGGVNGVGGNGGAGGKSNANCLIPIGASAGVIGQGGPVSQCNATGGAGGAAGNGVGY